MAQYDGSIRINTAIETKGLKQDIATLKGKLKELGSGINQGMAGVAGKISAVENSIKRLASGMRREVSGMKSSVDGLTGSFKKLGATIASVFAVRKIAGMASSMTELGSDLEEVQNVVDVTFTTMSDKVDEFAKAAARSAGLSETMAKRYVGTFGAMSKSFGFAEDAAFGMSTTLTQLAGDVASFYNISQDEAYTKLKSVFTGETETLKDLGVVMTENALNSYAMAKGIGKTVSKMTEQQKVALRYRFVLEKLSGASGDFVRTQDSWANQTRVLKLQLESLKATIGQGLINVLNPLLKMLNTLLEKLRAVANAFKSFTESFFGKTSAGSSGAGYVDTSEDIAGSLEDVSDAAKDAEKSLEGYLSPLDEINKYSTSKDKDLLSGLEDIDFGKLGDINMDVKITPDLDDSALSKKIAKMAEKVKSVLKKLFRPLKEAWDREGKSVMDSWKRALDEVWKTVKDIGRDFLDVWNQEKTIKILQNILGILSNVGRTAENLVHNFREAWNENDRGKKILENIRDITGKIVENIKKASDKTVEWADELDFAPLLESFEKYTKSLIPLADSLSGVLSDFYTKVLLPLGTWTIEKGLPQLLDVLTKFNEKVDWESLRKNLAEFWDHLEPFAETVGEGLIIFIERVSDALADFLNSQEFKDFLVTVENWMDSVTPEDVADALELVAKGLIALKLALLGYSAIKGITGIFGTIKSFLAIFGVGGSAAKTAANMDTVAASIGGFSGALTGLAAAAAVVGSYKLLTGHLEELFAAFGKSTDQGERLEKRYEGLDGAARFAKDGIDTLKNGIEGFGFAADNCVGTGVALEKAMEDIQNGAILTDEHMEELQNRFSLTDEDMEMLRQEMLDCNPILREIADNLGFEDASPETLQDIAEGFGMIANGVEPLPEDLAKMTDEARAFLERVMESDTPMVVYGEELENIGTTADNTCESLNKTGKEIADGTNRLKNDTNSAFDSMKNKIASASDSMKEKLSGFIDKIRDAISAVKDFLHSGYEKIKGSFGGGSSSQGYSAMPRSMSLARSIQSPASYMPASIVQKLGNLDIPAYAKGQVIPTSMKMHLALLGDNKHETEVVSPLSTIRQAQKESLLEALSELGLTGSGIGGNSQPIIIKQYLDGQQITETVIRNGKVQQMSTGSNPFLLGTT